MFYYGHPAVLYVNKLRVAGLLQGPINEYFEGIFEVGKSRLVSHFHCHVSLLALAVLPTAPGDAGAYTTVCGA
jgi:hypothetical protein